jgi:hypothetical protein
MSAGNLQQGEKKKNGRGESRHLNRMNEMWIIREDLLGASYRVKSSVKPRKCHSGFLPWRKQQKGRSHAQVYKLFNDPLSPLVPDCLSGRQMRRMCVSSFRVSVIKEK